MDCLAEWPEPVVPVESLAHLQTIPDRYVNPPEERSNCIASAGDDAVDAIPVVDLAALTEERVDAAVAEAVSAACRGWGFFQAVNHGVAPELVRRFAAAWRGFFCLPVEVKQRYANSPATYEGYGSRLGVDREAALDWSDYYFLHLLPRRLKDHRKWPQLPLELCEVTEEYGAEVRLLCRRLMRALSAGLGLQEGRLAAAFGGEEDEEAACMRINFYPKCSQPELALGLSPHSDPGGLTVLLPDTTPRDFKSAAPETAPGSPSARSPTPSSSTSPTRSKVVVNAEKERMSAAYFYNPRSDVAVEPLPELVEASGGAALYRPMTFDEYRLYIRQKGPQGKSQLSELYQD
ncbi:hypothetical protein ZIOFF_055919 [Zingiber officinale]|uniref:Fe2OG dioxygenase domain-containing protein n=1 Tax=Zingiber officinale TaxID=94328 RepID=A0A8J5FMT5_ZINOF|nr:hypothetical protein ZIOFF_055919 [Zingiber officinale]